MVMAINIIGFALLLLSIVEGRLTSKIFNKYSEITSSVSDGNDSVEGTKWAVLVAGSNGYENYRHQADVCHAYHVLKKGGLKDEHIIVFMYDDIAFNKDNPRPGVIINSPRGKNLYPHVPKDYTGKNLTASNVLAVIHGNKTAIKGGSGKVLKSGPNDHVFIYYTDHGGPGVLGMPEDTDLLYGDDLIHVLKKKHASKSYKTMVIYVEACESGSIFDGHLPKNLNIFVTTSANPYESSWATYCGGDHGVPSEYNNTCLGDSYSIAWLEDSDKEDPRKETLEEQYAVVKKRTNSSHVMKYGDLKLSREYLGVYFVSNFSSDQSNCNTNYVMKQSEPITITPSVAVEQREADLIYFKEMVRRAGEGSNARMEAEKRLDEVMWQRKHTDQSVKGIAQVLFGETHGSSYVTMVRPTGMPLVDDWDCLKSMVKTYEAHCGKLGSYGMKYMRAFANFCNAGLQQHQMVQASALICAK
ncbi:Vacuolar-processing enzyme [Bienertia sinuspersici]